VKIGAVDTEIALLIVKKEEEINASKIYSPVGNSSERAKQWPSDATTEASMQCCAMVITHTIC